jgi:hypothetical protein
MLAYILLVTSFQSGHSGVLGTGSYSGHEYLEPKFGKRIEAKELRDSGRLAIVVPHGEIRYELRQFIEGEFRERYVGIVPLKVHDTEEAIRLVIGLDFLNASSSEPYAKLAPLTPSNQYLLWLREPQADVLELASPGNPNRIERVARRQTNEVSANFIVPTHANTVVTSHRESWKNFFLTLISQENAPNSEISRLGCRLLTRFQFEMFHNKFSGPEDFRISILNLVKEPLGVMARREDETGLMASISLGVLQDRQELRRFLTTLEVWKARPDVLRSRADYEALMQVANIFGVDSNQQRVFPNERLFSLTQSTTNRWIRIWSIRAMDQPPKEMQRSLMGYLDGDDFDTKFAIYGALSVWNDRVDVFPRTENRTRDGRLVQVVKSEELLKRYWSDFLDR